tara:strand:- start:28869 stop:29735 length:867 start_codon:yes stop_codon:yes gene_type:complete
MFSVINRINRLNKTSTKNILVVQRTNDQYTRILSMLENVQLYLYHPWGIANEMTPANVVTITNTTVPVTGSFDFIICIGRGPELDIATTLRERFGIELIVVENASEQTYCHRPFGFEVAKKTEYNDFTSVSVSKHLNRPDSILIPHCDSNICQQVLQKQDVVCLFTNCPPQTVKGVTAAAQHQLLPFSLENLAVSKVFLDTAIGYTEHLMLALAYGCIPVVPYCEEIEGILNGKGYIFHKYEEVSTCVEKALADKSDSHSIKETFFNCLTTKQDFINKWNHILRGQKQ